MMIKQGQKNWLLDAGLWIGFLALFFLELTGVELHQWLGAALGFLAGLHLAWHWKWVKAVTLRFFGKTTHQARIYYLLDVSIFTGILVILASGLAISTWLNLPLANYGSWYGIHLTASITTLILVVGKIALHWRWIVKTAQDIVQGERRSGKSPALQPVPVPVRVSRRHFLSMMGLVGISAGAALMNTKVPDAEAAVANEETTAQSDSGGSLIAVPYSLSSSSSSSTTCSLRCNRRCSYPGQCRRYVDSSQNGKCDLGECA